jgi:hypothetical protein
MDTSTPPEPAEGVMGVRFTIDTSARLVAYVVEGDATLDEARAFLDSVQAHPDFERGFNFLGDRRRVDHAPTTAYIRTLADEVMDRQAALGPCLWAVIVGDDAGYGMARMWGMLTESSAVRILPFRTAEEATAWLGVPQTSAPLLLVPAA